MKKKAKLLILVLALTLALAPAAMAQFVAHGSLDPVIAANGFPTSVTDINGVSLDLPVPPYGDGINPPTLIFDPIIPNNSLSAASGFGAEAFFYLAESTIGLANGGKALLVLGIEAAYGAGDPDPLSPPDQFLFARVRVRFDANLAGTYTVTHPWGVEKLVVTAADVGTRFSYTNDWGGFAPIPDADALLPPLVPSSFERILYSPKQWVFLQADTKIAATTEQAAWIIGDGVTPTTVNGGTVNWTINGPADPNIPGDIGPVFATSNLFIVSGHIAGAGIPTPATANPPPPPPATDTVTIDRARFKNLTVEVRATSSNGFPMTAEAFAGGVNGTLLGSGNLGTNGRGNITVSGTPDTLRVHSTSANPAIGDGVAISPIPFP